MRRHTCPGQVPKNRKPRIRLGGVKTPFDSGAADLRSDRTNTTVSPVRRKGMDDGEERLPGLRLNTPPAGNDRPVKWTFHSSKLLPSRFLFIQAMQQTTTFLNYPDKTKNNQLFIWIMFNAVCEGRWPVLGEFRCHHLTITTGRREMTTGRLRLVNFCPGTSLRVRTSVATAGPQSEEHGPEAAISALKVCTVNESTGMPTWLFGSHRIGKIQF